LHSFHDDISWHYAIERNFIGEIVMQNLIDLVESFIGNSAAHTAARQTPAGATFESAAAQMEAALLRVREAGHALFIGQQAAEAYGTFLATVREEGKVGKAYVAIMYRGELELQVRADSRLDDLLPERLDSNIQFVLIDRSNRQGDAWKATFYPREAVTTFVKGT
jgi:hypothetical protein